MTPSEPDRISYSFGLKMNLGNYQSADFHISYTTAVKEDENASEAYDRAVEFVEYEADKKRTEMLALKG